MLESFLSENRTAIVEKWIRRFIESYPTDTSKFLLSEKDRFDNPVGYTISSELPRIYDQLIGDMDREAISASMDAILKIRAVQDFTPSESVGFILGLKPILREMLSGSDGAHSELMEFESKIDQVALCAFDSYMQCRERVHQVRATELRSRTPESRNRHKPGGSE